MRAHKPTLREVVEAVDDLAAESSVGSISYNIEIKSEPGLYGTFQPEPDAFAKAVLAVVEEMNIGDRCILQSFDPAILEAVRVLDPSIRLALLVENGDGVEANLKRLSFTPEIYSPALELMDQAAVERLHGLDMEVVVWTVNGEAEIRKAIALGVDGIISDHPDRVLRILDEP
jgi:glycerophosphoryl diester phosphodiesterase